MNVGAWIPQFFYDLLGRIVPGSFLILIGFFIFIPIDIKDIFDKIPTILILLIFLLIAYMIGALFGGIAFKIEFIIRYIIQFIIRHAIRRKTKNNSKKSIKGQEIKNEQSYKYDFIHLYCPRTALRIAKLRAELHMCRVLIVGSLLVLIFHKYYLENLYSYSCLIQIISFLILICSVCLFIHLTIRTKLSIRNNTMLIKKAISEGHIKEI
jgi:hypothetical protein